MKIARSTILPAAIISLCVLVGGPLQFIGALSLTQSNYLALSLISIYLLRRMSIPRITGSEVVLFALAAYIIAGFALNGSNTTGILVYIYYLSCPFLAARFVRHLTRSGDALSEDMISRWLIIFLIVQLLATITQNLLAMPLSRLSAIEVIPLDIVSGTFYMKSDGSLSAFCVMASMITIWANLPARRKATIVCLSLFIVLLANAKAFQQLFPVMIAWALVCETSLSGRHKAAGLLLLSLFGLIVLLIASSTIQEQLQTFSNYLFDVYDFRYGDNKAQRLAPLGEILNNPVSYFGRGALTYYNPISKQWLYNSGFSLVYNFYIDYGLIGLTLVIFYFLSLTIEIAGISIRTITLFSVLLVFCMFSPAITDIAFVMSYCTACYLLAPRRLGSAQSKARVSHFGQCRPTRLA